MYILRADILDPRKRIYVDAVTHAGNHTYTHQLPEMSFVCKYSYATVYTSRLALVREGLF